MPLHERLKKDPNTNKVMKDESGNLITEKEGTDYGKFPSHFLADTEEKASKLYHEYLATLQLLANKCAALTGLSSEDLIQEGVIGLARAQRDFEEYRSKNFSIFAIYKIKDAMREFVTSQGSNTRVPQYIKNTLHLVNKLKKLISSVEPIDICSLSDIWQMSKKYRDNDEIGEDVRQINENLYSLASRSQTTAEQLIERAELMPLTDVEITDYTANTRIGEDAENEVVNKMITREYVEEIKEILSKDDYNLLFAHFVEGKTVRELSEELKLEASSVTIKIHNIVARLNGFRGRGARNYAHGENIKNLKKIG